MLPKDDPMKRLCKLCVWLAVVYYGYRGYQYVTSGQIVRDLIDGARCDASRGKMLKRVQKEREQANVKAKKWGSSHFDF